VSHTTRKINLGNTALVDITVVNYTQGGEAVTLAEFGLVTGLAGVYILACPGNELDGYGLATAALVNGKIVIYQRPDMGLEAPTTVGLNFGILALVRGV
jgi:hypothetical protein